MGRHAEWELVNSKDGIIMIRDLERSGCLTITNDAEYVFSKINEIRRGRLLRVIYQGQNDGSEWWEIVPSPSQWYPGHTVSFKPWHGEAWDNLTKAY
jgi:hypothetical protein